MKFVALFGSVDLRALLLRPADFHIRLAPVFCPRTAGKCSSLHIPGSYVRWDRVERVCETFMLLFPLPGWRWLLPDHITILEVLQMEGEPTQRPRRSKQEPNKLNTNVIDILSLSSSAVHIINHYKYWKKCFMFGFDNMQGTGRSCTSMGGEGGVWQCQELIRRWSSHHVNDLLQS